MFGLAGIGTKLILGGVLLTVILSGAGYVVYQFKEVARLEAVVEQQKGIIESKDNLINFMKESHTKQVTTLEETVQRTIKETAEEKRQLYKAIRAERLGKTGAAKPLRVQDILNSANSDWNKKMMEITQ